MVMVLSQKLFMDSDKKTGFKLRTRSLLEICTDFCYNKITLTHLKELKYLIRPWWLGGRVLDNVHTS